MSKVNVEMEMENIQCRGRAVTQEIEMRHPGVLEEYNLHAKSLVDLTQGSAQNMEITNIDFKRLKENEVFKLQFTTKEKNPNSAAQGRGPFIYNIYTGDFKIKKILPIESRITLNFNLNTAVLPACAPRAGGGKRRKSRPKRKKSKRKHR